MQTEQLVRRVRIAASAAEAFCWHARPGAFERLSPPWEDVQVVARSGGIQNGGRLEIRIPVGPFWKRWLAEHRDYDEGRQFRDVQLQGPFARWDHTHRFKADGPAACWLEDCLEYAVPLGGFGRLIGGPFVRRKLQRLFDYRHSITAHDLAVHAGTRGRQQMRVLISGSTGLVGSALVPFLTTGGHEVVRLVRSQTQIPPATGALTWDPAAGKLEAAALEGFDAVVHLAGEGIAAARWTERQKARIRDSRVQGTRLLAETIARLKSPPKVFVSASAIGYYGDRGDEILTEASPSGANFLADVCRAWEAAAEPARQAGVRVVAARFGVILSPRGGALKQMLTPFRMGAGGVLGSGRQFMSWIALDDAVGGLHHALVHPELAGPVNIVAPRAATNAEFTKTLGRVLSRPTIFPVPAGIARLVFGQMADELLLASARVEPRRLLESGYQFRYPELEDALRHVLGKTTATTRTPAAAAH
jgi:hypothetical protein